MADRFPGGVISKTPPAVSGPAPGTGGAASGVWTLDEMLGYVQAGVWPGAALPPVFFLYSFGANDQGQLGINNTVTTSSPALTGSPAAWMNVDAGNQVSIGVKYGNTLHTWGDNNGGLLGQGTSGLSISASSPVQVGALTNWASGHSSYRTMFALKTDDTLWGWGSNTIGDGTTSFRSSPVQIGSAEWAKVSTGRGHTHAIKTAGTLWGWGYRTYYATGQGFGSGTQLTPAQIGVLTTWSEVSAGDQFSLAIKTDGTLWAWGRNNYGQLGLNSTSAFGTPAVTQVGSLTTWAKVSTASANNQGATFAIKTDGTLWSWGRNSYGKLGHNNTINKSSPVQVGALTNWATASIRRGHCLAVKTDGTLWAWGDRNDGRTANYFTNSSPVQVGALATWSQAAAGQTFSLALLE